MTKTFTDALAIVLKEEGGFVDDARDPGGATNMGVTARTWSQWTGRPASDGIMRALTPITVAPLYKAWFWDKICCDALPPELALPLFDFAVNAGPPAAVDALQSIVGAQRDGQLGKSTRAAIEVYMRTIGVAKLIARFCDARRDYYRARAEYPVFGKGWLARTARVEAEALRWLD
jgi:lysozyme family protein